MERNKVILNTGATADVLGITTTAFLAWKVPAVRKDKTGTYYDLKQVITFWKEKQKQKQAPLTEQRARYVRLQADRAELELSLYKNDLHEAKIIKDVWTDQILRFRSRLLSLPVKMSMPLSSISEPLKIEKALQKEVLEILEELQEYRLSDYTTSKDLNELQDDPENIPDADQQTEIKKERIEKKKKILKHLSKK